MTDSIRILQVDAFADRPFSGNPAAVCLLNEGSECSDDWMQAVAEEMNLSETAFVRRRGDKNEEAEEEEFELRWFTPLIEVDLCGHATLAAAHVLWTEQIVSGKKTIHFHSRSGILTCERIDSMIELNFPATPAAEVPTPPGLLEALGLDAADFVGKNQFDKMVVVASENILRQLNPDFAMLERIPTRGVIVTSPSDDDAIDFVSRFFAPAAGVNEDPVTGSAHCCLAPYWASRLGKTELTGYQASRRGGVVQARVINDRVILGGQAVTVLRGDLIR